MKVIISPAKKMNIDTDTLDFHGFPVFLDQTKKLMTYIQGLSYEECKSLWNCNDRIARQNFTRFAEMDLEHMLTPAILSYEGIQYQYMAPVVFEDCQYRYIQKYLRILSGFYGVLKPMDGVTPYRLEMQAKLRMTGYKDLYEFWGSRLYQEVIDESHILMNLASKEYFRCIEPYLQPEDTCIICVFGEYDGKKVRQKGTYAKMARGEMVRFMAEQQIEDPCEIKKFDRLGYQFREDLSSETEYVFCTGSEKRSNH